MPTVLAPTVPPQLKPLKHHEIEKCTKTVPQVLPASHVQNWAGYFSAVFQREDDQLHEHRWLSFVSKGLSQGVSA